ncbi:MAG: ethanolamine utilization protein EutH [Lachnospiraceae bacterium]
MWVIAVCVILGGMDRLLGNHFGLGEKFEQGFLLLGSTALSMVGIICLVPLLSAGLETIVVPIWEHWGLDSAMLGGILAIDMGGYQMAMELARDSNVGNYAGIMVAATFGCTFTFTIPVGMGMLEEQERVGFSKGILIGVGVLPVSLILGGILCSLSVRTVLIQTLPIFVLSFLLIVGIWKFQRQTLQIFSGFAALIRILTTVGLILGAVSYITGVEFVPGMTAIEEGMKIVSSIGIVMLGSLPMAELLQRILKKPLNWLGKKTGMNSSSVAGLLVGVISVVPAIAMMKDMDCRGRVVNAACLVSAASAFAAHMGFTFGVNHTLVVPMLAVKLVGGFVGIGVALLFTKAGKEKAQ